MVGAFRVLCVIRVMLVSCAICVLCRLSLCVMCVIFLYNVCYDCSVCYLLFFLKRPSRAAPLRRAERASGIRRKGNRKAV